MSKRVKAIDSPKKKIVCSFPMTRNFIFQLNFAVVQGFFSLHGELLISSSRIKGLISLSYLSASAAFKSNTPFSISVLFSPSCRTNPLARIKPTDTKRSSLFICLICNWLAFNGDFIVLKSIKLRRKCHFNRRIDKQVSLLTSNILTPLENFTHVWLNFWTQRYWPFYFFLSLWAGGIL